MVAPQSEKTSEIIPNSPNIDNENWWTTAMYVGGVFTIFPLSNIVIPLIIWLLKKEQSSEIKKHGVNVLNFQITLSIILVLGFTITIGATIFFFSVAGYLFLWLIYVIIKVVDLICSVIGGVKAYKCNYYELPLKFNFIK